MLACPVNPTLREFSSVKDSLSQFIAGQHWPFSGAIGFNFIEFTILSSLPNNRRNLG
jgi:hypothetical protein